MSGWYWQHHFKRRTDIDVMRMDANFGKHIGYAYLCKLFETMGELGGGIPEKKVPIAAVSMGIEQSELEWMISDMIASDEMELRDGVYIHFTFINDYTGMVNRSNRGKKAAQVRHAKDEYGHDSEPPDPKPSQTEAPKPKKEKKKPEPEPDVELTPEGMALRSDVVAYTYDLDFNEDLIEMTNKEWNRIAERHGDDAELRCRFYYEWKASKLVNGKRFKNLDFHTINTASWINDKVYLSRRHNGKSNKQLTGAPLEPGTGRAALLHGE